MEEKVRKYLKNAYMVYSEQKTKAIVGIFPYRSNHVTNPRQIGVRKEFFEKMRNKHPEVGIDALFLFVYTINIPDEVYKTSFDGRLNFIRKIPNTHSTNIVGTKQDGGVDIIVTSFITSKNNYVTNIRKTAEAVFLRGPEGTAVSPICDVIADSRADSLSSG